MHTCWMISAIDLLKARGHKYIRRWKGPDGKWQYAYPTDPSTRRVPRGETAHTGTLRGVTAAEVKRILKQYRRRAPGQGREQTIQTRSELDVILTRTTFALMSAGRNPNNPEDMKLTDAQVKERHRALVADLKDAGYVFSQCRGKYDNPEESVMVMTHDADRDNVLDLGAKYNQDSVVVCSKGRNEMVFTTGSKKGNNDMQGTGYEEVPDADNYYTKLPLATGETIKFTMLLEDIQKALREWLRVLRPTEMLKGRKMPIGTVSRGRKKVAEGKWVPVPKGRAPAKSFPKSAGHIGFVTPEGGGEPFEYYHAGGNVFRAPVGAAMDRGYRIGRFESTVDQFNRYHDAMYKPLGVPPIREADTRSAAEKMKAAVRTGPKVNTTERKLLSEAVNEAVPGSYFKEIPIDEIDESLRKRGFLLLQEDNTPWAGMLLGAEGSTTFTIGRLAGSTTVNGIETYTPIENSMIALSWYKDDKRRDSKYDVVAYAT